MIEFYPAIKWVHVFAVLVSGALFFSRGLLVLAGSRWGMAAPSRYLSYAVDSVLLTAALMLLTILPSGLFANGWLGFKIALLLVYIVLGVLALRRAPNARAKALCFAAALVVYLFMLSVARAHHPLGALLPLWG